MDRIFLTTPGKHNQWFEPERCTLALEKQMGGFLHKLYRTRLGAWVLEQQRPKNPTLVEQIEAPAAQTWLTNMGFWTGLDTEIRTIIENEVARFEV